MFCKNLDICMQCQNKFYIFEGWVHPRKPNFISLTWTKFELPGAQWSLYINGLKKKKKQYLLTPEREYKPNNVNPLLVTVKAKKNWKRNLPIFKSIIILKNTILYYLIWNHLYVYIPYTCWLLSCIIRYGIIVF